MRCCTWSPRTSFPAAVGEGAGGLGCGRDSPRCRPGVGYILHVK